ncbi:MAG: zinc finger domain-containing protein [Bacteroidia bacterium]
MELEEKTKEISNQLDCRECGALLKFAPGTTHLKCEYCGAENEIKEAAEPTVIEEIDFEKFLNENGVGVEKQEIVTVKCGNCGASTTLKPNITSDSCPFCDSPIVITGGTTSSIIKPKYLLPFKIDQKAAFEDFKNWVKSLWFAPNNLKDAVNNAEKLNGMYIPYWTYDSKTVSDYTGERGDNYLTTETYTTVEDGKTVTRERTVTRVRWSFVSGTVNNDFDDVLVLASNSLPEKYTNELEPWDMESLTQYNDKFLSGFRTESYQVDVKTGFEKSKVIMAAGIRDTINADIGGDYQRINNVSTTYSDITFKHILLPIWLSAYRYNEKVYHFLINGRTGEVQGERPYSTIKIVLTVIAVIAIGVGAYFGFRYYNMHHH